MKDIILQYLEALESGSVEKLTRLFSDEAIIHSPLYGDLRANDFFKRLFADTNRSIIHLINIFSSIDRASLFTAHFRYDWILKSGAAASFECMDIFQFNEQGKIKELTIIYDTNKIRGQFEALS